jgi:hypothetical protein
VGSCLDESNVLTLLPKALTAKIEAVLADETRRVSADTAVEGTLVSSNFLVDPNSRTAYSW